MKIVITLLIFKIIIYQITCSDLCKQNDQRCITCSDENELICLECKDSYKVIEYNNTCQSYCDENFYYNPKINSCVSICDSDQIENSLHRDCENIQICPTIQSQQIMFHTSQILGIKEINGQFLISYDVSNKIFLTDLQNNTISTQIDHSMQDNIFGILEIQLPSSYSALFWTETSISILSIEEKRIVLFQDISTYGKLAKQIVVQGNTLQNLSVFLYKVNVEISQFNLISQEIQYRIQIDGLQDLNIIRFLGLEKQNLVTQSQNGQLIYIDIQNNQFKIIQSSGYYLAENSFNDTSITYFNSYNLYSYDITTKSSNSISYPYKLSQMAYLKIYQEQQLILIMSKQRYLYLLTYKQDSTFKISSLELIQEIPCSNNLETNQCDESVQIQINSSYLLSSTYNSTYNSFGYSIAKLYRINLIDKKLDEANTSQNRMWYYYLGQSYYFRYQRRVEYTSLNSFQLDNSSTNPVVFSLKSNFSFSKQIQYYEIINIYSSILFTILQDAVNTFYFIDPISLQTAFTSQLPSGSVFIKDNDIVIFNKQSTYLYKINKSSIVNLNTLQTSNCNSIQFHSLYIFQFCSGQVIRYDRGNVKQMNKYSLYIDQVRIMNNYIYSVSSLSSYADMYNLNLESQFKSKSICASANYIYPSSSQNGFLSISSYKWCIQDIFFNTTKSITNNKLLADSSKYTLIHYNDINDFILVASSQALQFYRISTDIIEKTISNSLIENKINLFQNYQNQLVIIFNNTNFQSIAFIDQVNFSLQNIYSISPTKNKQIIYDSFRNNLNFFSTISLQKIQGQINSQFLPKKQVSITRNTINCQNKIFLNYDVCFVICNSSGLTVGVFQYSTLQLIREKEFSVYNEQCKIEFLPQYQQILIIYSNYAIAYQYKLDQQTKLSNSFWNLDSSQLFKDSMVLVYKAQTQIYIIDYLNNKEMCKISTSFSSFSVQDYYMYGKYIYVAGTTQTNQEDCKMMRLDTETCQMIYQPLTSNKNVKFLSQLSQDGLLYIQASNQLIVYDVVKMKIIISYQSTSLNIITDFRYIYLLYASPLLTQVKLLSPFNTNLIITEFTINNLNPAFVYYFPELSTIYCILQNQVYVLDDKGSLIQLLILSINVVSVKILQTHGLLFLYSSQNQLAICDYKTIQQVDVLSLSSNFQLTNSDYDMSSNLLQVNNGQNITLIDLSLNMMYKQSITYLPIISFIQNKQIDEQNQWIYIIDNDNQIWRYQFQNNLVELVNANNKLITSRIINQDGLMIATTSQNIICIDGSKIVDSVSLKDNNTNFTQPQNLFSSIFHEQLYISRLNSQRIELITCSLNKKIENTNILEVSNYIIQQFIIFQDNTIILVDENLNLRNPQSTTDGLSSINLKGFIKLKIVNDNYFLVQQTDQIKLFNKQINLIGNMPLSLVDQIFVQISNLILITQNLLKKLSVYSYDEKGVQYIQEIYLPCQQDNIIRQEFNYILIVCPLQINFYTIQKFILQYIQTIAISNPNQLLNFGNKYLAINQQSQILLFQEIENQGFQQFKTIQILNQFIIAIKLRQNRILEEYEFILLLDQKIKTFVVVIPNTKTKNKPSCFVDIIDNSGTNVQQQIANFLENRQIIGSEFYQQVAFNIFDLTNNMLLNQIKDYNFFLRFYSSNLSQQFQMTSQFLQNYNQTYLILANSQLLIDEGNTKINPNIKKIILKNITVKQALAQITFENMNLLIIDHLTFSDLNISTQVTSIFKFLSNLKIQISNLEISQNSFSKIILTSFFEFSQNKQIQIQSLSILDHPSLLAENMFNFIQGDDLYISDVKIFRITSLISSTIFNFRAIKYLTLIDLQSNQLYNIQLINNLSTFQIDQQEIKNLNDTMINMNFNLSNISSNIDFPFIDVKINTYSITKLNLKDIKNLDGKIINIEETKLTIDSSSFSYCESKYGALSVKQLLSDSVIRSSQFENCKSQETGGAINIFSSKLLFINNKIFNNYALIGGAIYYDNQQPIVETNNIRNIQESFQNFTKTRITQEENKQIFNNTAKFYGQNIGSMLTSIKLTQEKFKEQLQFQQINQNSFKIDNFRSGGDLQFRVSLFDEEGNQLKMNKRELLNTTARIKDMINSIIIYIVPQTDQHVQVSNQIFLSLFNAETSQDGFLSSEIKIIGNPLQSSQITIFSLSMKNDSNLNLIQPYETFLKVNFRDCIVGEVFEKRESVTQCKPCENGFYSLFDPKQNKENKCLSCPDSAYKCNNNNIYLKEGFWRRHDQTDNIIECYNKKENCLGSKDGNKFYCEEGKIGALCETCDYHGQVWGENYMRASNYNCKKCSETTQYIFLLPLIGIVIFILVYIIFSVNMAIKLSKGFTIAQYFRRTGLMSIGTSAMRDLTPFYVKQLMHYLQIVSLINVFGFDLPAILTFIPDVISLPLENIEYSFDCILNDLDWNIPITFLRALWSLLIPFLFLFSIGIIYLAMILIRYVSHNKFYVFNGLFFMLIFLQTNIISTLVYIISCRSIDGLYYIKNDTSFECYTPVHFKFSLIIVLPGLLLWLFVVPYIIIRELNKNKAKLETLTVRFKFGFLYQEFKDQYYYWEFIKSYQKILIVIFHNVFIDYIYIRVSLIAFMLILYNQLVYKVRPYKNIKFNSLDLRIMNTLIFIHFMNLVLHDKSHIPSMVHSILSTFTALFHYLTFLNLILLVVYSKLIASFFNYIQKLQKFISAKCPCSCIKINFQKPINCVRASKNWRKVKNLTIKIIEQKNFELKKDPFSSLIILNKAKLKLSKFEKEQNILNDVRETKNSKFSISKGTSQNHHLNQTSVKFKEDKYDKNTDISSIQLSPDKRSTFNKLAKKDQSESNNLCQSTGNNKSKIIFPIRVTASNYQYSISEEQNSNCSNNDTNLNQQKSINLLQKSKLRENEQPYIKSQSQITNKVQSSQSSKNKISQSVDISSNSSETSLSQDNIDANELEIKNNISKQSENGIELFDESKQKNQFRQNSPSVFVSTQNLCMQQFQDSNDIAISGSILSPSSPQKGFYQISQMPSQNNSQTDINQGAEVSYSDNKNIQLKDFSLIQLNQYEQNNQNNDLQKNFNGISSNQSLFQDSYGIIQCNTPAFQLNFQKNKTNSFQNRLNNFTQKSTKMYNFELKKNKQSKHQQHDNIDQECNNTKNNDDQKKQSQKTIDTKNQNQNNILSVSKGLIRLTDSSDEQEQNNYDNNKEQEQVKDNQS